MHDYPLGRAPNRSCVPEEYTNLTQFRSLPVFIANYTGYVVNGSGGEHTQRVRDPWRCPLWQVLRLVVHCICPMLNPAAATPPPVILGEVASTAEGGCDGLSNRFVAGFVFIYELAATAEAGAVQASRWAGVSVDSGAG